MNKYRKNINRLIALLIIGSAITFISCSEKESSPENENAADLMTQQSENMTVVYTKEGNLDYSFKTPLMERYEQARNPFMEFRKGIFVERYGDSTHTVESTITANYAIYLEKQQLWEAKGNVVAVNKEGQKLETEQLYWDQKAKRIYSNVDSKLTQGEDDVIYGEGFESDESLQNSSFRNTIGQFTVEADPSDSTAVTEPRVVVNQIIKEGKPVGKPNMFEKILEIEKIKKSKQ